MPLMMPRREGADVTKVMALLPRSQSRDAMNLRPQPQWCQTVDLPQQRTRLPRSELLRHPIRALGAPAIGAVVGDVVAFLDQVEHDWPIHFVRQSLGILRRH